MPDGSSPGSGANRRLALESDDTDDLFPFCPSYMFLDFVEDDSNELDVVCSFCYPNCEICGDRGNVGKCIQCMPGFEI